MSLQLQEGENQGQFGVSQAIHAYSLLNELKIATLSQFWVTHFKLEAQVLLDALHSKLSEMPQILQIPHVIRIASILGWN